MYSKIVVGTDLSATSGIAVVHAASLAEELDADLILVYAGEDPGPPLEELAKEHSAESVAVPGPPADVLISEAAAQGADLLVVGSVGMSGAKRFALGNVPNKISHHIDRDLLIVKTDKGGGGTGVYKKILVGADGSSTAMSAVEMASGLASKLGAVPTIVTAYEPPSEQEMKAMRSGASDAISTWNMTKEQKETPRGFEWRIAGAAQAEDILERASDHASKMGVEAEVRAVEGPPVDTLIDIAESENFDLIVVGSVGMAGAKRFMLGNVPNRLSHHTPVDILILHTS